MTSYVLLFVLGFGVVARVTRFITADVLAAPVRAWVTGRWGPDSRPDTLVHCPWCAGIWIAAPVAVVAALTVRWPIPAWQVALGLWLTWSYLYGLLAQTLDGDE